MTVLVLVCFSSYLAVPLAKEIEPVCTMGGLCGVFDVSCDLGDPSWVFKAAIGRIEKCRV